MGLLEFGSELYFTLFKITILFSFVFFIFSNIYNFIDIEQFGFVLKPENFGISEINSAIDSLKNAKGLDVIVAFGSLIISIFGLLIISFINSILLIKFGIQLFINAALILMIVDAETAITISNILSWIIIMPAIIGIFIDMARALFYTFFRR